MVRTGKLKGKTGKVEILEDYIDPDLVKEGYESRTKRWKEINHEKDVAREKWKEAILAKKRAELEAHAKMMEQLNILNVKTTWLLENTLTPEAFEWLDELRKNDFQCCDQIVRSLFDDDVLSALDDIIRNVNQSGGIPVENRINLQDLVMAWRRVKGIKGKIMVQQKDGGMIELGEMVRESKDYRGEEEDG